MKLTSEKLKNAVLIPSIFLILMVLTVATNTINRNSFSVLSSFFLNGIVWLFLLIREINRRAFSISLVHWFFCLFFFFFAGLTQYVRDIFPRKGLFSDQLILRTNLVLLAWTFLYSIGVYLAGIMKKRKTCNLRGTGFSERAEESASYYGNRTVVLLTLSILILFWKIYSQGIANLFISARATSTYEISSNSSINVLVDKITMAISYFAVIFSFDYWRKKKGCPLFFFASCLCLFVSFFPLVVSRNTVAGLYLGILLYIAFFILKKGRVFFVLYLFSFVIMFPLLNSFRYGNLTSVSLGESFSTLLQNFNNEWLSSDYDAYSMLLTTMRYIGENGITFGRQLLGVIFFWVPRTVWAGKPIASGEFLGSFYQWDFVNVSEPLVAEILINFGLIGIVVLSPFVGYFVERIDSAFWSKLGNKCKKNRVHVLYTFIVAYVLFVFRGALLSSFAYLCAVVFVWFVFTSRPLHIRIKQ